MKNGTQEKSESTRTAVEQDLGGSPTRGRLKRKPTSVSLTTPEIAALKAEAQRRNVKPAALIREAIRQLVGQQHSTTKPPSIGIADGIVEPDIVDDVVELANEVMAVGYAAASLETHLTRRRRAHVRLLLQQTMTRLNRIAGTPSC